MHFVIALQVMQLVLNELQLVLVPCGGRKTYPELIYIIYSDLCDRWPISVFSWAEHEGFKVSYGGQSMSVVRRRHAAGRVKNLL